MRHKLLNLVGAVALAASAVLTSAGGARADLSINLGTGATKYTIMNLGASGAAVSAAYYPEGGNTPDVTDSLNIANSLGRLDVNVASVGGLAANWKGSVVLSSDQQVVAVANTSYTGRSTAPDAGTANPGTEMASYEAVLTGYTLSYFPSLFRNPMVASGVGRVASRITVMNTTGSSTPITLTFTAADGTGVGSVTATLNPYGSRTFNTAVDSDLPVGFVTAMSGKGLGFAAKLTSDRPVAAVAETNADVSDPNLVQANYAGDYMAVTAAEASTKLFNPAAFRLCPNNVVTLTLCSVPAANYKSWIQYSSYQLMNTSGSLATVNAKFYNGATGLLSYTLPFTIPGNAGFGVNLFNGGGVKGAAFTGLVNGLTARFAGSVIFESDQPLAGVASLDFPQAINSFLGTSKLVSSGDATGTIYVPSFNRQCPGGSGPSCPAVSSFDQITAIQLMNVGTSQCNGVNILLLNPNGSTNTTLTVDKNGNALNLAPGGQLGINSFNGGSFNVSQFDAGLGYNFAGTAKITSPGCQLKAVVGPQNGTTGFDQYNAFNQ